MNLNPTHQWRPYECQLQKETFLQNLLKFIEAHGNCACIEGGSILMETQCVTKNGAIYIERDVVSTYGEARKILGY